MQLGNQSSVYTVSQCDTAQAYDKKGSYIIDLFCTSVNHLVGLFVVIYSFVLGSVFNILQALINKVQITIKRMSLNQNGCLHLWFREKENAYIFQEHGFPSIHTKPI